MINERSEAEGFRRAALWLALLMLTAFAGDHLLAAILDRLVARSGIRFSQLYRGALPPGVLVLGDSRGVTAIYAPRTAAALGVPVFNLAYNGQSTRIQEALLHDYLDHNAAPKLVLIEVTSVQADDELLSELKLDAGRSTRIATLYRGSHPIAYAATTVGHLFRYDSELFLRSLYYLRHNDQAWANSYRMPTDFLQSVVREEPWRIAPRQENIAALTRMTALLQARGIQVRLFVSPYLPQHLAHLANLDDFVASIGARTGLNVWNFANAIDDSSAFADRIHLNIFGTGPLLRKMQAAGFFAGIRDGRALNEHT